MSDIQYVYPLIHNKVTSPHYVTPTLRRARLIDWLNENSGCRAVVVAADAGYGKTTLLWQWEREVEFPCYWYKLDRNDRDWSLHISYLIEAISQRHAGFGRRAHSMLEQMGGPGTSRPGVAAYLLAEMHERLTEPCTFIIDDWQFVASVTEVRGLWNQILRDAPPTCRFVFLSRAKPQLQFARFKTHGGYAEMRTDALRFNDLEIEELFRDVYNDPLNATELAELERRTEGWAVSLQLVEVSLRERKGPDERQSFLQSITATRDSDLFEFLAEEVLEQQDERTRNFLLSTAILHQITAGVAERLAGIQDGDRVLRELEERGLFTYRLEPAGRFRYHALFRDFLERKLEVDRPDGEIVGLHIHAASYFETSEEWPEAIHHYLRARLQPQAGRLIARYGEEVANEGRVGLIDEWLEQLPAKSVRENARLSLLLGEALGIRGDWDGALLALTRARRFFARKGDRRVEALADLKLSTVQANRGRVRQAADTASHGLAIAPKDAVSTRLRLRGNLAITALWLESPFEEVIREFRSIVVEAKSGGWEHFAAIGLHNLGSALRHVGRIDESVRSLELAAQFWSDLPANPFADNAELVASLLAASQPVRAEATATTAVLRTKSWPRPNADARFGRALVLAYQGQLRKATEELRALLAEPRPLGPTSSVAEALLMECLFLGAADDLELRREATSRRFVDADPRLELALITARAIATHVGDCTGQCLAEFTRVRSWAARGATFDAAVSMAKLACLAVDHPGAQKARLAVEALKTAIEVGAVRQLRWWIRRLTPQAKRLTRSGGLDLLISLADKDPEGWRETLVSLLPSTAGASREKLLGAVQRHATRDTVVHLAGLPGSDVAAVRKTIIQRQATQLLVRSFGSLVVHRGTWEGPTIVVERHRTRVLLGLLASHVGTALTREMVLDLMWPESDPGAAINNLNQTVFQLRRILDADYRDGESPQYVISNLEVVQLNPALVRTDLAEFRRLRQDVGQGRPTNAAALVDLIRGQYLADLRYEDWVARLQTTVHAEVRETLLLIATGKVQASADLSIRASSALIDFDEFDDFAYAAMAHRLEVSGRRSAAKRVISRYAQRLKHELDEDPSPEISTLMKRLDVDRGVGPARSNSG